MQLSMLLCYSTPLISMQKKLSAKRHQLCIAYRLKTTVSRSWNKSANTGNFCSWFWNSMTSLVRDDGSCSSNHLEGIRLAYSEIWSCSQQPPGHLGRMNWSSTGWWSWWNFSVTPWWMQLLLPLQCSYPYLISWVLQLHLQPWALKSTGANHFRVTEVFKLLMARSSVNIAVPQP